MLFITAPCITADNGFLDGTEELLYYRQDIAAQSQVPAWIFVPGGTYLINSSLQLPVYTMLSRSNAVLRSP